MSTPYLWTFSLNIATAFLYAALLSVGLEVFLFDWADFNLYRVLDLSIPDGLLIGLLGLLQYAVFKHAPKHYIRIWESGRQRSNAWLILGGATTFACLGYHYLLSGFSFIPFLAFFGGLGVFSAGYQYLSSNPFKQAILLILCAAGMNSALFFWLHEETNKSSHLVYAQEIAETRDTIAEAALEELVKIGKEQGLTPKAWEKEWLQNPYLSSNYRMQFHPIVKSISPPFFQPVLIPDEKQFPVYWLHFPNGQALSFHLLNPNQKSVYADHIPYKYLTHLNEFRYALVRDSQVVFANTHDFDVGILEIPMPEFGQMKKIGMEDYDVKVYHHSKGNFVLIGEPLSEFQVGVSNFAFFFWLMVLTTLLWEYVHRLMRRESVSQRWGTLPIQDRIQAILIGSTLMVFVVIALTTFYFLNQNNHQTAKERKLYLAETVQEEIRMELEREGTTLEELSNDFLRKMSDQKNGDIDVYNMEGELIASSFASVANSPSPDLSQTVRQNITTNPVSIIIERTHSNDRPYLKSSFGLVRDQQLVGFALFSSFETEIGTAQDIPVIMSNLLNVYTLLLLLAWVGGFIMVNVLSKPLETIARRLASFQLGKSNEKLFWSGDDAIGHLVQEYNNMIDTVEETRQELMKSEREGAWQIMAQQIAHEVNNTLTPIRLNLQYFSHKFSGETPPSPSVVKRITNNLEEQTEHLAQTASQFQLFAKMGTMTAEPLDLSAFLMDFTHHYALENHCELSLRSSGISPFIKVSQEHLRQILHNMVENAEQAISEDQNGTIELNLRTEDDFAIISVEDNGSGIPDHLQETLFNPTFSTRSSRTGLGLAICSRIVRCYGGSISFDTELGVGTTFYISLPMIAPSEL